MSIRDLTLASPAWIWAMAALPVLVALFIVAEGRRRSLLGRFISAQLQPRLAGSVSIAKRRTAFALKLLALVLGIVALARPQLGFVWEESKGKGRDILIAVDTSRSMLADDLRPNRLARAKLAAQDLLSQLEGDRAGVIAFAGEAFLSAPLTPDFNAVRETLNDLDTEVIPRGGTNLTEAIREAAEAFGKGESQHQALIIFTDGEELEADAAAAAREHRGKFSIFTVGLGSPLGSKIPVPQQFGGTDFVRDEAGQLVLSKLDEPRLVEVAEAGGGFYVHLENGPAEMRQIVREGLGKMNTKENEARVTKQPIERYQWPLAGALVCLVVSLLIGERRRQFVAPRAAALAVFLAMMFSPDAAHAGKLGRLLDRVLGNDNETPAAPAQPKAIDPTGGGIPQAAYNNGCTAFQAGDFETAARAFSKALGEGDAALQERAAYNLANTLARRGATLKEKKDKITEWKNALQHYDHALRLNANHADAAHNRGLIEQAIAALEKEPPKEDKKDEKKDEEKKDDKSQQDQKSGDEKKDQQQEQKGDEKQEQQKGDEKKDEQGKKEDGQPQPGEQGEPKDTKPQQGDQPQGEPKQGDIKPANPEQQGDKIDEQAAEAAEAAAAALEGRMTEKDAKQLLESLRRYDVRGRLQDPKDLRRLPPRQFKNW